MSDGITACQIDVASRVTAGALRDRFVRGLIDGMRCGILAVDRDLGLALINEIGRQVLDLDDSAAARVGVPVGEALACHPQIVRVLADSFEMASLPNRAEIELNPGTDQSKTIGFTMSMIPGPDGEPLGAAMFFKDLTQIEHKQEQDRLKDRLAALGEMAASMAHEIRNPLASIGVTCSLLRRRLRQDDRESHQLLEKISAEITRLNTTISSSLEFVRPLQLQPVFGRLDQVLQQAVDVAARRRGRPGIVLEVRDAETLPPFLMDPAQLRQVFENLVLNAMEAVGEEGQVTVTTEVRAAPDASSVPYPSREEGGSGDPWARYDRFALVRICDSGPGIDAELRSRIFYPFFTTKKQGSGVGLSMAKKIVNSHRGLIDVDNLPDGGARFSVRLPMVLEPGEVAVR